ncbi:hypothetical protein [Hymenobacter jeollabukensis]|uniref:Uncharacterized protein n=1 Tax=Hymenobacter jeollabukensis TaxID=2025313 RepID=A0A5R8WPB1_9BACT|nr:hypothetical protein [Hymenobacter jeollabukensis]TLM91710.1 hypothetical protein FDY95_14200 [Hymenobacter jeollabukensis]
MGIAYSYEVFVQFRNDSACTIGMVNGAFAEFLSNYTGADKVYIEKQVLSSVSFDYYSTRYDISTFGVREDDSDEGYSLSVRYETSETGKVKYLGFNDAMSWTTIQFRDHQFVERVLEDLSICGIAKAIWASRVPDDSFDVVFTYDINTPGIMKIYEF